MVIVLLGYMGSGKSTVGMSLAQELGLSFTDLDVFIEAQMGQSISEVFQEKGEVFFRKKEHDLLKEWLKTHKSGVLALGGGTPCYANNHELLQGENRTSIYLKASIDTLFNRLLPEKAKRPLIADKTNDEMKEFIAMHLFERSFYYNQAQHTVAVDGLSIEQIVVNIEKVLKVAEF